MKGEKGLIDINDPRSIIKFLQSPTIKIAEALTGVLSSEGNELKLTAGRLVQASIKRNFLKQLGEEIKKYQDKGKIKEDYFTTHKERASLCELLKFIDEEGTDEERFNAMKSIFLYSVTVDTADKERELAFELLKICKRISASELLILKACYDISNGHHKFDYLTKEKMRDIHSASEWMHLVSEQIGHGIPSLVAVYEDNLEKLNLITTRQHVDKSGIGKSEHFRLTGLGYKLCEFINKYP